MNLVNIKTIHSLQRHLEQAILDPRFRMSRVHRLLSGLSEHNHVKRTHDGARGRRAPLSISEFGHTAVLIDLIKIPHLNEHDHRDQIDAIFDHYIDRIIPVTHLLGAFNASVKKTRDSSDDSIVLIVEIEARIPRGNGSKNKSGGNTRKDIIKFLTNFLSFMYQLFALGEMDVVMNNRVDFARQTADLTKPLYIIGNDNVRELTDAILDTAKYQKGALRALTRFKRSPDRYSDVRIEYNPDFEAEKKPETFESNTETMTLGDLLRKKLASMHPTNDGVVGRNHSGMLVRLDLEAQEACSVDTINGSCLPSGFEYAGDPVTFRKGETVVLGFNRAVPTEEGGVAAKTPFSSGNTNDRPAEPEIHQDSGFRAWADQDYEQNGPKDD